MILSEARNTGKFIGNTIKFSEFESSESLKE